MKTMYIMIGNVGSGKSTIAKKIAKEKSAVVISSDPIRQELFDKGRFVEMHSRQADKLTFAEFHNRLRGFAKQGKDVVIDATNTKVLDRRTFLDIAKEYGYTAVAVVVKTDIETCIKRVIKRQTSDPKSHYIDDPIAVANKFERFLKEQPVCKIFF